MTRQHATVADAARMFGISQDAVRMRIKRGKLESDREGNRLYVWANADQTTDPGAADHDELLEAYRDQIAFLRRDLERRDQLLAAALSRIPEIEAPSEPPGAPEPAESPGPREDPLPTRSGRRRPQRPDPGGGGCSADEFPRTLIMGSWVNRTAAVRWGWLLPTVQVAA